MINAGREKTLAQSALSTNALADSERGVHRTSAGKASSPVNAGNLRLDNCLGGSLRRRGVEGGGKMSRPILATQIMLCP